MPSYQACEGQGTSTLAAGPGAHEHEARRAAATSLDKQHCHCKAQTCFCRTLSPRSVACGGTASSSAPTLTDSPPVPAVTVVCSFCFLLKRPERRLKSLRRDGNCLAREEGAAAAVSPHCRPCAALCSRRAATRRLQHEKQSLFLAAQTLLVVELASESVNAGAWQR